MCTPTATRPRGRIIYLGYVYGDRQPRPQPCFRFCLFDPIADGYDGEKLGTRSAIHKTYTLANTDAIRRASRLNVKIPENCALWVAIGSLFLDHGTVTHLQSLDSKTNPLASTNWLTGPSCEFAWQYSKNPARQPSFSRRSASSVYKDDSWCTGLLGLLGKTLFMLRLLRASCHAIGCREGRGSMSLPRTHRIYKALILPPVLQRACQTH